MQDSEFVTLYRIVRSMPPTVEDMMSNEALRKELRDDSDEVRRLWAGLSMFDALERARKLARRHPWHGVAFIATVRFPASQFVVERTGKSRGHYTVWGDPHAILESVAGIEPA